MPNAIYLIRDANVELSKGNFELANKYIKEADFYWRKCLLVELKEEFKQNSF